MYRGLPKDVKVGQPTPRVRDHFIRLVLIQRCFVVVEGRGRETILQKHQVMSTTGQGGKEGREERDSRGVNRGRVDYGLLL